MLFAYRPRTSTSTPSGASDELVISPSRRYRMADIHVVLCRNPLLVDRGGLAKDRLTATSAAGERVRSRNGLIFSPSMFQQVGGV